MYFVFLYIVNTLLMYFNYLGGVILFFINTFAKICLLRHDEFTDVLVLTPFFTGMLRKKALPFHAV